MPIEAQWMTSLAPSPPSLPPDCDRERVDRPKSNSVPKARPPSPRLPDSPPRENEHPEVANSLSSADQPEMHIPVEEQAKTHHDPCYPSSEQREGHPVE